MRKLLVLAVLVLVGAASWAQARIGTGQWLHDLWPSVLKVWNDQSMNALDEGNTGIFTGFVQGAALVMQDAGWLDLKGITLGQWIAVVGKYLQANPEQWNIPAQELVYRALCDVWPGKVDAPYQPWR